MQNILHICNPDKFINDFIEFIERDFSDYKHEFVFYGGTPDLYQMKEGGHCWQCRSLFDLMRLIILLHGSRKIIIHSLSSRQLCCILSFFPWVHKKVYWAIWGEDLYLRERERLRGIPPDMGWRLAELYRKFIIKRFGNIITVVEGDYALAKKWYGSKARWHECFMYPSNVYEGQLILTNKGGLVNIQVGNSADPANHHMEILERLRKYSHRDVHIYCPLSYGDPKYAQEVSDFGRSLFGKKFTPLFEFIGSEKYSQFLSIIDIGIFNHRRQQAMGNIIKLIGMGKKVFMRREVTSWKTFSQMGIVVCDVASISLDKIDLDDARRNHDIVTRYFSNNNLHLQLEKLFRK